MKTSDYMKVCLQLSENYAKILRFMYSITVSYSWYGALRVGVNMFIMFLRQYALPCVNRKDITVDSEMLKVEKLTEKFRLGSNSHLTNKFYIS